MSGETLRLDKWLWHARFLKSRSLASKFCQSGKVRINGEATSKAHHKLKSGDVLTFPLGPRIRVIKVLELGTRRGPAKEAQSLYEDLEPPEAQKNKEISNEMPAPAQRDRGAGRPTKTHRRAIDRLMGWFRGR